MSDSNDNQHINTPTNQNYSIFKDVSNDIYQAVTAKSVVSKQVQNQNLYANPIWQTLGFDSDMLMMPVPSNKTDRINQYRKIAKYAECNWCLDEICDEFIHEDESGNFINLRLPDEKKNINETRKSILQEEFNKYISLFKLKEEGYSLIKRFLVEGELAWENIINKEYEKNGIIGIRFLPPEYYETLIDTKTNVPVGIVFDTDRFAKDIKEILSNNYIGSASIFNAVIPTTASYKCNLNTCIPMLWSQVTYISSEEKSLDGNQYVSQPILENAKQAYYQLALLQDAAVILRVTRAPERLLYNVSTGNMNDNLANELVRNFANSLKAKKVAASDNRITGQDGAPRDIASVYNPVTMLENYVFAKNKNCEGTTIESVGSTADYEQLADIEYFLRRFMKAFKVPFSRYKTPENATPQHDQLSYEEHSFLKMIIRLQNRFALGFKNGFITHLKLRGMWDKYELKESDIKVEFVKPTLYNLYEIQQTVETKMNIYKAVADEDLMSKSIAMKKYLGFSEDEVKENFMGLIKEKMITELGEFYSNQISEKGGLAGWESPIPFMNDFNTKANVDSDVAKEEAKEEQNNEENSTEENTGSQEKQNQENPPGGITTL